MTCPARARPRRWNTPRGRPAATDGSLGGLSVLVVDDEADARTMLAAVLGQLGAGVLAAGSAREGLRLVADRRPDVVLTDIGMPGEDGYAFARALRALPEDRGGRTPAIAVTAYGREEDVRRAIESGFDAHVTKPATRDDIVAAIQGLGRAAAGLDSSPAIVARRG